MRLKYKSILFIAPLLIIPLLLTGFVAYEQLKESSEKAVLQKTERVLNQIASITEDKILSAKANIKILANNAIVKQYALLDDDETRYRLYLAPLLSLFKEIQKTIDDYYDMKFVLPDGYKDAIRLNDDIINISEAIDDTEYFSYMLSNMQTLVLRIYDENINDSALLISTPIMLRDTAKDGVFATAMLRGFLTISIKLQFLENLINQFTLSETGFFYVIDENTKVLISSKKSFNAPDISQMDLGRIFQKNTRSNIVLHEGEEYIVSKRKITTEMMLVSLIPESEVVKQGEDIRNMVMKITIITTLITVMLFFTTLQKIILKPLQILSDAAKAIGNGKVGLQVGISSTDEIGTLAKSINVMSKSLQDSLGHVSFIANHDALTGLPNRSMFNKYFNELLIHAKYQHREIALLFFDLDDFKQINDTLGHDIGDQLLITISDKLIASTREGKSSNDLSFDKPCDLLARLGGDEFVLLLNDIESPMDATAVAERILKNINEEIVLDGNEIHVSCSIGITLYPGDADSTSELIRLADIAMYHAKELGKNNYQFFSNEMNTKIFESLNLKLNLNNALENNEFELHYQPKVNALNNDIVGMEALIRWNSPSKGLIYPDKFIGTAEESGLITAITEWVMNEACRQNASWQKKGLLAVPVSINVSSLQFKRRDLIDMVEACLQKTGIAPQYLELELTEYSLLEDTDNTVEILTYLKKLGIEVALDDFGTGYSSLSYLEKFPIQTIKIDRSFILSMGKDNSKGMIVNAIIALGHALNLQVIAEGVEKKEQLDYLLAQGDCHIIQGHFFSKALPADIMAKKLEQGKIYPNDT